MSESTDPASSRVNSRVWGVRGPIWGLLDQILGLQGLFPGVRGPIGPVSGGFGVGGSVWGLLDLILGLLGLFPGVLGRPRPDLGPFGPDFGPVSGFLGEKGISDILTPENGISHSIFKYLSKRSLLRV